MSISEFVATTVHVPFDETTFRNPTFSNSYLELHPTTQGCRLGSLSPQPFVCRWTKQLFTTRLIQLVTKTTSHNRRMSISEVVATTVCVPLDQTDFRNPALSNSYRKLHPTAQGCRFRRLSPQASTCLSTKQLFATRVVQLVPKTTSHNPRMSISEFVATTVHVPFDQTTFRNPALSSLYQKLHPTTQRCLFRSLSPQPSVCLSAKQLFATRRCPTRT